MKEFVTNELLQVYVQTQRTSSKKLMWVLGPVGTALLFYWTTNIFSTQPLLRVVSFVALCAGHFTFTYWGTLVADGRFMNRLVEGCQVREQAWAFTTVGWFLKKPVHCSTTLIQEVVRLETSFFKKVGPVYKVSFVAPKKFEHVYLMANAFEEFEQLQELLHRSITRP